MALSITELELQSAEYLPAREVMTTCCGSQAQGDPDQEISEYEGHTDDAQDGNEYQGGILNGVAVQDVLTDINAEEIQVSLVNVLVEDVQDAVDLGTANDDEHLIDED
jgi:hypothetical protein